MIRIEDINDTRIEPYLNLRLKSQNHNNKNIFVADSLKVVRKLIESNLKVLSIFATKAFFQLNKESLKNIDSNTFFYYADSDLFKKIVGYKVHQGVLALSEIPEFNMIKELTGNIGVLNKIIDAENVGAIIRNCAAFGINSLIIDSSTTHPYLRRAVRVSMGNVFIAKIYRTDNLIETIDYFKAKKYQIYSIENNTKSESFSSIFPKSANKLFIFGNEGSGIDEEILASSDKVLRIPMNQKVESLNVAVSSGIILQHFYNY